MGTSKKDWQMDDWRKKPRTGKSQVVPWVQQIQTRLDLGATIRQVYEELLTHESITLGYRQFIRYVHELTSSASRSAGSERVRPLSQGNVASALTNSNDGRRNTATKPQPTQPQTTTDLQRASTSDVNDLEQHPFHHLSERNNPNWKHDGRLHNSVPDHERIYGTKKE